jgi:hypothetical protein
LIILKALIRFEFTFRHSLHEIRFWSLRLYPSITFINYPCWLMRSMIIFRGESRWNRAFKTLLRFFVSVVMLFMFRFLLFHYLAIIIFIILMIILYFLSPSGKAFTMKLHIYTSLIKVLMWLTVLIFNSVWYFLPFI